MNKIDRIATKLIAFACFVVIGVPTIFVGVDYAVTQHNVKQWQKEVDVKVTERTNKEKEEWERKMNAIYKK